MRENTIMLKRIIVLFLFLIGISAVSAAQNVIDVTFSEKVYEYVTYNPLKSTTGNYVDANENRTLYEMNGTIFVENRHSTEEVQDVILNITGLSNIYNASYLSGNPGYVLEFNTNGDFMILLIPDLGAGENTTFRYDVNTTNVAPPLNITSTYSDSRIFAGIPITVTDRVQNTLNNSIYTDGCIYDINITQYAMTADSGGVLANFTYDSLSTTGSDATNVTYDSLNRTQFWSLSGGACFGFGNITDITYDVNTPPVNNAKTYGMINSTITYAYNETLSQLAIAETLATANLRVRFDKYMETILTGDNATWRINGSIINPTNITVNITEVSFWVSIRDGTGTGFTNPGLIDNDTISGAQLLNVYNTGYISNNTLPEWNNVGNEWYFNYTYSSSPIVWMDLKNTIVDDGIQLTDRDISYGENSIYVKELYLATGYWLEISKNITRLGVNDYSVLVKVENKGTSSTPVSQVVQVYNFLPIEFNLTSPLVFSSSPWYTTVSANETLSDPVYNGTMFQFGIMPNGNPSNSSLDAFTGVAHINNTWTLAYNVTGTGEFNFEDLFLTGVDPLNVKEYGSTLAVVVEGTYEAVTSNLEYVLEGMAVVVALLTLFM